MAARIALGIALALLCGCAIPPHPPTYTEEELKQRCEGRGGWWRPDNLMGGFCEIQSPGFI